MVLNHENTIFSNITFQYYTLKNKLFYHNITETITKEYTYIAPCSCPPKMRFFTQSEINRYPKTALISFPSSGNGFMRDLLQLSTGIFTGDVYHSKKDVEMGFLGFNRTDSSVVAIKTHKYDTTSIKHYDRAILLTRDPYECMLSSWIRFKNKLKQRSNENNTVYINRLVHSWEWKKWRHALVNEWCTLHENWLTKFNGPVKIVHYENLKQNRVEEMSKVLDFLGFEVNQNKLSCLLNNTNYVKREKGVSTKQLLKQKPYQYFLKSKLEQCKKLVNEGLRTWKINRTNLKEYKHNPHHARLFVL